MGRTEVLQEIGMQRCEEIYDRFSKGRLRASEASGAAEWLGVSERTFCRQRARDDEGGLSGLLDRRLGKVSPHSGWTVKHFHERLVAKLADAGITTLKAANRFLAENYLPRRNARFAVEAAEPGSAFVPVRGVDLTEILCQQEERVVGRDNTVRFEGLVLQIPPGPIGDVRCRAVVARDERPAGNEKAASVRGGLFVYAMYCVSPAAR